MYLLFMTEGGEYATYVLFAIVSLIITFLLVRWAVRADSVVRNQEIIIHIMIQQFKKQGATDEELKDLQKFIGK